MKYHRLHIDTDGTFESYNKITKILGLKPAQIDMECSFGQPYGLWTYEVDTEDEYFDFINQFLDILEPKFVELKKIGVNKDDILFWLNYEFDQQCSLEFHPQDMMRLAKNDIHLNIDCFPLKKDKSTNT